MCGIIGQFGGAINEKKFLEARDVLSNRGPDDCGVYYDKKTSLALGHRRLSIIDLSSSGKQPMTSGDGRYTITFNGEIFNFIELRKELKNYQFKTKTDTEVILAAYKEWGKECLVKLNGQFAFAIYDKEKKELFCARDHLGVKPFYYTIKNKTLLFASEIKALFALGVSAKPNDKIIFEFLRYSFYDHSKETFFKGINRLMPGEYAIWKGGKLTTKTYWDLASMKDREGEYDNLSKKEAIELFKTLMADAVRLQFRSDVPVGLTISSGLDSMSLLFFANTVMQRNIHLFSAGLEDKKYDEVHLLNYLLTKEQKKLLKTSTLKNKDIWALAEKLLYIQDEPYGGFSTINYFNLYNQTKIPNVTVLLEGQGADEILGGYKYYQLGHRKDNLSQDMTKEGAPDTISKELVSRFGRNKIKFPEPFKENLLNMQYRDMRYIKLPRVLRFQDHISLAFGKELRVPYLDHRLVEFCFFLPKKYKVNNTRQKILLRDAMQGIVPDLGKNKPKVFFGAFQTEWIRKYFKDDIYKIVDSKSFKTRPYWDYKKVKEKIDDFFAGHGDNSFFIWQFINLEMWLRKYID